MFLVLQNYKLYFYSKINKIIFSVTINKIYFLVFTKLLCKYLFLGDVNNINLCC